MRAAILLSLALVVAPVLAGGDQRVRDLHYGEVLFQFYQDDYLTAATHLMAAQQQQRLPHHERHADLLLGGMLLSYGMRNAAEQLFRTTLDSVRDDKVRDRVWYYLGKIAYTRGAYADALAALGNIQADDNFRLAAEAALLRANTRMALGDNLQAAGDLKDIAAPGRLRDYLEINRAIALLRAGKVDKGLALLEQLGESDADGEELRALRDRANLGLGYELLRAGRGRQARRYLNRVRLESPFANAALLGAGWSDSAAGKPKRALTPWLELGGRSGFDAPVQEAQLAIPYAFEQLGDRERAVHFYRQAIDYYDREQAELDNAVAAIEGGAMLALLDETLPDTRGGWLNADAPAVPGPAGQYLVEVLAGHRYQETLKHYRDVMLLQALIERRIDGIDVFNDMVETRRLNHARAAPVVAERLQRDATGSCARQVEMLREKLQAAERDNDPLALATTGELQQWRKLETIRSALAAGDGNQHTRRLAGRAAWLQGVLRWQMHRDYPDRLWQLQKTLRELEPTLAAVQARHARLAGLLQNAAADFDRQAARVADLRVRLLALQPRLHTTRVAAGEQLQRLALDELDERRERLASYRSQAQYALARNYDQLSANTATSP